MFRIKICGVTQVADIEVIASSRCDAIGLNFAPSSPRCLSVERAIELSRAASGRLTRVGVFMNPTFVELGRIVDEIDLDAVQLHGQESPQLLDACRGLSVVKALAWNGTAEQSELCRRWRAAAGKQLGAFLIDAHAPGVGGGTGRIANWSLLVPRPQEFLGLPLLLAGGLKPANVAEAIRATHCDGVDTASGVEIQPGFKEANLVREFASNAREALAQSLLAGR